MASKLTALLSSNIDCTYYKGHGNRCKVKLAPVGKYTMEGC